MSEESPLETLEETTPIVDESLVLKKISPAKWECLTDVLNFLTKDSDDAVVINDSVITHALKTGAILKVDLSEIFDNEKISLHISNPKKWNRLFKTFNKNQNIYITEGENQFIVTDGQTQLFLPKQVISVLNMLEIPDLSKTKKIVEVVFQKESRDQIMNISKNINYIEFLIKDNYFKVINIPNTGTYILPEFLHDDDIKDINPNTADLILRSSTFLPYDSDIYNVIICYDELHDKYFMYSSCKTQLTTMELYEVLDNATGLSSLF